MFDGVEVSTPDYFNGYNFHYFAWGNLYHRISRGYTTGAEWLTVQVPGVAVKDDYYTMESQWYGQTSDDNEEERVTVLKGFVDGVEKLSATNADYTSRTYMGFNSWGEGVWLIDRVMIRKCQANEPTAELTATFQRPAVSNPTPATETTSFVYDDFNKLTGITYPDSATETLTYNDNGQLTRSQKSTGEVTAYEWNDQGMLKKVILPTGEPVEYFYDGNQRLVSRKSSDGVDKFVQSGWDIVTEMDDLGKRTYYTGSSAIEDKDSVKYFHYNHRGDTILVTDAEGNPLNNFTYEAYGKATNSEGININNLSLKDIPNLFVGASGIRYDTKTNLHYMRFRWFSPEQMRFISIDPIMNPNRFSYVNNDPINNTDPLGLWDPEGVKNRIGWAASRYPEYFMEHYISFKRWSWGAQYADIEVIPTGYTALKDIKLGPFKIAKTTKGFHYGTHEAVDYDGLLIGRIRIPFWYTNDMAASVFIHEHRHHLNHKRTCKKVKEKEGWCFINEFLAIQDEILFYLIMIFEFKNSKNKFLESLPTQEQVEKDWKELWDYSNGLGDKADIKEQFAGMKKIHNMYKDEMETRSRTLFGWGFKKVAEKIAETNIVAIKPSGARALKDAIYKAYKDYYKQKRTEYFNKW